MRPCQAGAGVLQGYHCLKGFQFRSQAKAMDADVRQCALRWGHERPESEEKIMSDDLGCRLALTAQMSGTFRNL